MEAISSDSQNKLRWSRKGYLLAMDIAKGLVHLHASKVCCMELITMYLCCMSAHHSHCNS